MPHRQTIYHCPELSQSLPRLQWVGWKHIHSNFQRNNRDKDIGSFTAHLSLNGAGAWWPDADQSNYHQLNRGDILLFFSGEDNLAYGIHPEAAYWETAYFNISGNAGLQMGRELLERHGPHFSITNHTRLMQLMEPMLPDKRGRHQTLTETQLADLAMKLILSLWDVADSSSDPSQLLIQQAQQLMSKKINVINVQGVAEELQVSREHLTRCFKAAGLPSPAVWLKEQRLQLAELLIREDEATLEEIALFVGFESYSHFFRLMTQRLGCQPSIYRARYQSKTNTKTPYPRDIRNPH